jgi:hypothetical protein
MSPLGASFWRNVSSRIATVPNSQGNLWATLLAVATNSTSPPEPNKIGQNLKEGLGKTSKKNLSCSCDFVFWGRWPLNDCKLPTPKTPADVDAILAMFKQLFGRVPHADELSMLEFIRQLLVQKQAVSDNATGD